MILGKKIKIKYKAIAKVYDLMDIIFFPKRKANPRIAMAKKIENRELNVLDVCTGTGNSALHIAEKNRRNKIIAIDLSDDMLKVARKKAKRKGLRNIKFIKMDATKTTFRRAFDVVTASLALHEMDSQTIDNVMGEMARVLKKDGRLYIIEWDKPRSPLGSRIFNFFPSLFEPKGFDNFLKLNWKKYLKRYGLELEKIEKYAFTKLVIAVKS